MTVEVLLEYIDTKLGVIAELDEKINVIQEEKAKQLARLSDARASLQLQCKHEKYTRQTIAHYEGGYLDRGYTKYANVCNCCGFQFGHTQETGSYA